MDRAIRIVTAREVTANAAHRWRDQYAHWSDEDKFADGVTKGARNAELNALTKHTPAAVAAVLNKSWTHPQCVCCGERVDEAVQFSDWTDREITLCGACLDVGRAALSTGGE